MKGIFLVSVSLALLCDCGRAESPPGATSRDSMPAADPATATTSSLATRLFEWNLRPEDIRDEIGQTGRVIRTRTASPSSAPDWMDGETLASLISAKFQTDSHLSGLGLRVAVDHGAATLSGTADTLEEIGNAMAIALDTEGVTKAISLLKLRSH